MFAQGPRSNFEIGGGGGTISGSILGGGTKHIFLLILYNFKNIGAPLLPPPPFPTPRCLLNGFSCYMSAFLKATLNEVTDCRA